MKKMILYYLFFIILLINPSHVMALNTTWNDITTKLKEVYPEESNQLEITETTLKIKNKESIETNFQFENNTIQLLPRFDKDLSNEQKVNIGLVDMNHISILLNTIASLNNMELSEDRIDEKYGIELKTTDVSYSKDENGIITSGKIDYIENFSINLEKFETAISTLEKTSTPSKQQNSIKEPTMKFHLEHATSNSITLAINVENLTENQTATCEVYTMPSENEKSQKIKSFNCINGNHNDTISNLEPNTTYSFLAQLKYTTKVSIGSYEETITPAWQKFKTTTEEEQITNPKTGSSFIYIIIMMFSLSVLTIIHINNKMVKENRI